MTQQAPAGTNFGDLAVVYAPTDSLAPYINNARKHSRTQIKRIADSLREFGWGNPIITDGRGGVLCGHGRLEAARLLGLETVPTVAMAHLNEAQRRAYILADNALAAKAKWDKVILTGELQGLLDVGYDVELTGFDTIEIDTLLTIDSEFTDEIDEHVELPDDSPPVTRFGDHWVIGRHHLLCGDARASTSYIALLAGELAELIFSDPPYNVRIAGNVSGLGRKKHGEFLMGSGELSDTEFAMQLLRPALRNIARHSVNGTIAFICMDWRGGPQLLDAAEGVFAELKNLIVWAKPNAGMGSFYRSQHEFIYAFKVSRGRTINNFGLGEGGRHRSNLWTYAGANTFRRGRMADLAAHPTVKPRKLVADAILDCSRRGGIVLDPFLGSGTTLAAAEVTGRRGFGIELDPAFCDVILRRMQEVTGQRPHLVDGTPYTDVASARLGKLSGAHSDD